MVTGPAWRSLKALSAREGLVAAAYERRQGACSRVVQLARLYLFGASSGLFNCPLAMTDGAARLCELLLRGPEGQHGAVMAALGEAFSRLTSRDPRRFITSGQVGSQLLSMRHQSGCCC